MHLPYLLFVDDDPDEIDIAHELFCDMHMEHRIQYAHNGVEALAFLERAYSAGQLPALMVLDMNMPKMNGIETLQALKHACKFNSMLVYVHSTAVNEVTKTLCQFLGATDFICKGGDHGLEQLAKRLIEL